jgi:hypothetical protein
MPWLPHAPSDLKKWFSKKSEKGFRQKVAGSLTPDYVHLTSGVRVLRISPMPACFPSKVDRVDEAALRSRKQTEISDGCRKTTDRGKASREEEASLDHDRR